MLKASSPVFKPARPVPLLFTLIVGIAIYLINVPYGVDPKAWQLLSIFIATIVGTIVKALPIGGMSLLALAAAAGSQTLTIEETLSGFSSPVIWLIVVAFLIARCFIKTGLGLRVAYIFIRLFGKHTLSLSYSLAFTDLLLAPAIPSNTARAGGILFPVVSSLALGFDSDPKKKTEKKIGSFLIMNVYYINLITSAMFMTAMASNPLIVSILSDSGIEVTWLGWLKASVIPGIISFITIPYFLYRIYPPEIKSTPHAASVAEKHLESMGPVSKYEWITLIVFALLIFLWTLGAPLYGLDTTTSALIGLGILLLTGVLTWDDVKHEHEAFDTLIWFSSLLMMGTFLNKLGLIGWFSGEIQKSIEGISWWFAAPILVLIYFYSHYFFASITAHVSSMFAAFLGVGIALGAPPMLLALSLTFASTLMATLTHYGTGSAPILYGSGYVTVKEWWWLGFIMSLVTLFIWIGIGSVWWSILGLW